MPMIWPRRSLTAMVSGTLMEPAAAWTIFSTSSCVSRLLSGAGGIGGIALEFVPLLQEMAARLSARQRADTARDNERLFRGNARAPLRTARLRARRIGKT